MVGAALTVVWGAGIGVLDGYTTVTTTTYPNSVAGQTIQQVCNGYVVESSDYFKLAEDYRRYTKTLPLVDDEGHLKRNEMKRAVLIGESIEKKSFDEYLKINPIVVSDELGDESKISDDLSKIPFTDDGIDKLADLLKKEKNVLHFFL